MTGSVLSNENIFMFEFYSLNRQFEYTVYSVGKENMVKFLQHHNLMEFINDVKYCDDTNDITNDSLINEFVFYSNKKEYRNKPFKVYTTIEFIEYAVDKISQMLCDTLVFGSIILREDIKFIEMTNDCINKLPHIGVIDLFDINSDDDSCEMSQIDFIYESMHSNSYSYNNQQSITIEAYVRCFAEMLCDEY